MSFSLGKCVRAVGGMFATTCTFASKVISAPVKVTTTACAAAVRFCGAKRIGNAIENVGDTWAGVIETPMRTAGHAVRQTANVLTLAGSSLSGDYIDEIDAQEELEKANKTFVRHFKSIKDDFVRAVDNVSGRVLYDEAKKEYNDIRKEERNEQKKIDTKRIEVGDLINDELSKINVCRKHAGVLFKQFELTASAISSWTIHRYEPHEVFRPTSIKIPKMPYREKVFSEVDFDKSPMKNYLKGLATGGMLVASEVSKVREHIRGMKKALKEEKKKAHDEIKKWVYVRESVKLIRENFEAFIEYYEKLIQELDYAINLIRMNYYQRDLDYFRDVDSQINPYFLPDRHLKCLMACDKMSRILCIMAKQRYLDSKAIGINSSEYSRFKDMQSKYEQLIQKVAA